jgi:hypothetical protein
MVALAEVSESVRGDVLETANIASKGKKTASNSQHLVALADAQPVRDLRCYGDFN